MEVPPCHSEWSQLGLGPQVQALPQVYVACDRSTWSVVMGLMGYVTPALTHLHFWEFFKGCNYSSGLIFREQNLNSDHIRENFLYPSSVPRCVAQMHRHF